MQLAIHFIMLYHVLSSGSFVTGEGGVFALRCLLSSAWRGPAKTQDAAVHRAETEAALNNESLCLNCRSLHIRLSHQTGSSWSGSSAQFKLETPWLRCNPLGSEVSPTPLPSFKGKGEKKASWLGQDLQTAARARKSTRLSDALRLVPRSSEPQSLTKQGAFQNCLYKVMQAKGLYPYQINCNTNTRFPFL